MVTARFWMVFGAILCAINGYEFLSAWSGESDILYSKLFLFLGGVLLIVIHWLEIKQLKKMRTDLER
ncbi:hypothetical protein ACFFSY_08200 [Paenibacillus aurantiacus]|uniref:DUF3995 domain-containing protein n=1 Tax=Paenibacillus aurantiacus TaxID=1936118 RepID=A0ABV5KNU8_9BACL